MSGGIGGGVTGWIAELRNVTFRYPGSVAPLLKDITLALRPAESVVLVGANGSGKSTIVQLLCGSLAPQSGLVRVFGADPARVDRLPSVGFVTEPFHPALSPLPVALTGAGLLSWLRVVSSVDNSEMESLRETLQIAPSLMRRPIGQLSKGERQRMLLLSVLARKPQLLLADEPLEGLDPVSRGLVSAALFKHVHTEGAGLLWVSHHISEVRDFRYRLIELGEGRLVEHPSDRFRFRWTRVDGVAHSTTAASLDVLPAFAEAALAECHRFHIEVEQ